MKPTVFNVYDEPNNIYRDLPHKRMEFWHRNLFIFGFDIDSAEVSMYKKDAIYNYNSYYKAKGFKNVYSIEGGQVSLKLRSNSTNPHLFETIKTNICNARKNMICIDGVLRNKKTNNYLQLNLLSSGHSALDGELHILKLHFAALLS